jgi:hypothetical protein
MTTKSSIRATSDNGLSTQKNQNYIMVVHKKEVMYFRATLLNKNRQLVVLVLMMSSVVMH